MRTLPRQACQEKTKLLQQISNGDVQQAIDGLLAVKRSESLNKEALAIAARYNSLKQKERSGTISFEQLKLTENQITEHLIELINHPEDQHYPEDQSEYTSNTTRSVVWRYIISTALIILVLLSLAQVFGLTDIISSNAPLQLTVFVEDEQGNPQLEGKGRINIALGNRPLNKSIGEHGSINFSDITPNNIGDTITIGLEAKGWEIIGNNTFVFTGKPITLKVKRDDSLGTIKGTVMSRDGQEFIERAEVLINTDTIIFSDPKGRFKIILPEAMRVKNVGERYKLTVSKTGYQTKTQPYQPNSTPAEIRLDKAEN